MNFSSVFKSSLAALSANKARTALTSLGITIGIAAVIAMVSAGNGAKSRIDSTFSSLGPNLVVAFSGRTSSTGLKVGGGIGAFSRKDAEAIRLQLGEMINGCSEVSQSPTISSSQYSEYRTSFAGGVEDVFRIRRWKLTAGRFYNAHDVKRQSNVCVLGATVAKKLFPNIPHEQIVNQSIRGNGLRFSVVGVLEAKGSTPAGDQDDIIMVPISTQLKKILGTDKCMLILVEARSTELVDELKNRVDRILMDRRRIKPGDEPDFNVRSMQEYSSMANLFANTLSGLIFAIASISLIVGGIGVMNIMLVSVTERTREIGIRMAVGARTRDVMSQFLTEAVILALIGGAIGITLGIGCAAVIAKFAKWEFVISTTSVVVAAAVSAVVGIFFGYYPARKASLLDPIESLRYE